jgi:hypothetical protein
MPRQPQYLANTAELVRALLDPEHPQFKGDKEMAKHLKAMRLYMHTWVFPLIDVLKEGKAPLGMQGQINHDVAMMKLRGKQSKPGPVVTGKDVIGTRGMAQASMTSHGLTECDMHEDETR